MSAIEREIKKIEKEIEELKKLLQKIEEEGTLSGWIEYKWVKNKVGAKYWYYYYRYRDNGVVKSVYLGKHVSQSIARRISNSRMKRWLERRITKLERELEMLRKSL